MTRGKRHPKDKANFVSKITLWWTYSLLKKGSNNTLEYEDLYAVTGKDRAEYLTKRLEDKWTKEKGRARKSKRDPKLWKAMLRFFKWKNYGTMVLIGLLSLVAENVIWFSTIKLSNIVGSDFDYGVDSRYLCLVYIYGIAMGNLVRSISLNHFHLYGTVLGIRARSAAVGLLYKKVLCVSKTSMEAGHVMELICDDSQRLATSGEYFIQNSFRQLLSWACAISWLIYFVGWEVIPGTFLLILLGLYRLFMAKVDYGLRKRASQLADKRLGFLREILTGIHAIKLNCFEGIFEQKIQHTRWQEIKSKTKRWIIMSFCYSFYNCGQQLGTFVSIVFLVLICGLRLSYEDVFAMMILIKVAESAFCQALPEGIRLVTDVYMSLHRIQNFLEKDDHLPDILQTSPYKTENKPKKTDTSEYHDELGAAYSRSQSPKTTNKNPFSISRRPYLELKNVTCRCPSPFMSRSSSKHAPSLNYITLDVSDRGLVAITGPVGSGKSSLLECILGGEQIVTNGTVMLSGRLAYVSHTPWVFPGTVRDNILFGLPYNEDLYRQTIQACQLEEDFKILPQGDGFPIGVHRATVSGGQLARIALARAVYSQADIYLLDDPLSSSDAEIAENIFENCLKGLLANRVVLLTTHTPRYLRRADYIVKLRKGVIIAQGTFEAIKDQFLEEELGEDDELNVVPGNVCTKKAKGKEPIRQLLEEAEEDREIGNVSFKVYREYFTYGAPVFIFLLIALVFFSGQGVIVVVDVLVSSLPELSEKEQGSDHTMITYSVSLGVGILLILFGTISIFLVQMNAAYVVHNKMVACLAKAPLSFHMTNPVGRIINRLSQHINNLDELLPDNLTTFFHLVSPTIATFVLAPLTNIILLPIGLFTLIIFYLISRFFFNSIIDIRRLMSMAGGPLYSHFSNTMEGVRTIRVYNRQNDFTDEMFSHTNNHAQAMFAYFTAMRWFSTTMNILCVVFSTVVSIIVVFYGKESSYAGLAAVTIIYAFNTVHDVQHLVRVFAKVHSQMTSAEATIAYTKIDPEMGHDIDKKPPKDWPHAGSIQFKNVSLRYYKDGPTALRDLTFEIKASEKIGIVGHTGAGKSSLVAALMRMAETAGEIIVDGINIMDLNVLSTRRGISVISHSSTLISSSIRVNLDPSAMFTDSEIWDALAQMQMKTVISSLPHKLESVIMEASSAFSVGERQLLNLARVLLRKSKIIIFDEATGKMDRRTDEQIQEILRNVFKDCTVITIAQRLSTILECDRIMLLDCGKIIEFDKPEILWENETGLLHQLCRSTSEN